MRKYGIMLALIVAGACKGGDGGTEPLVTTSLSVSATPTQISVNETAQASAIVKDQNGNPLQGKTIAWSSLNPSIATVNGTTGQIKGVAPGNATIQGSVDGVTGTATISVVAITAACASGVVNLDIQPGEVRVINTRNTGGCIKVASTAAASSYVVIAANTNPLPDQVASFSLRSDEGETIPANVLLSSPYVFANSLSFVPDDYEGAGQDKFEMKLRETERRILDLKKGKAQLRANDLLRGSVSTQLAVPNVGDKTTFRVPKANTSEPCKQFATVTATVKYVGTRGIVYLDDAAPANGFSNSEFQDISNEFDNLIYPTDVANFGTPRDQDNNQRIIILYTGEVNKLTSSGSGQFVGGFFFNGDFFPNSTCEESNLAEIFYLLAPDPSGSINNNPRSVSFVRRVTRGTIAHEFQHMLNASERWNNLQTTELESVWLDEALSHTAEDLNGRALRGFNETSNLTFSQLFNNAEDYNAFFFQNFARLSSYLSNPGQFGSTSRDAGSSLEVRGAAWSLVRYAMDHYAPGGDTKAFLKSLTPGPDTGVVNLTRHAGNVSFDSLATGWLVANYADDAGIPNLNPKYTYKTYDMRDNVRNTTSNNPANQFYPLKLNTVGGTGFVMTNISVKSGSGVYFVFSRGGGAQARTFRMLDNDLANAASFTGATLILLRTQ